MNLQVLDTRRNFGAFASVILDQFTGRAFKLFKSDSFPGKQGGSSFPENVCRDVFRAEVRAYEICSTVAALRAHTPEFFGVVTVEGVTDRAGNDISAQYLLDCCYSVSICSGNENKLNMVDEVYPYLRDFTLLMQRNGIRHIIDTSVFSPESEANFKVIDFAASDVTTDYENALLGLRF